MNIANSLTKLVFLCLLVLCRMAAAQQVTLGKFQVDHPDAKCGPNLSKKIPSDIYCLDIKKGFFGSPTGERIEGYFLNGVLDTTVHTHVKTAILPWWNSLQGARTPNSTPKGERKITGDGLAAFYLFNAPPDSDTITFVFSQNASYRKVLDGKLELADSDSSGTQDSGYIYKPKQQPVTNDSSFSSSNCNQPKTLDQLLGEKVIFVAKSKKFQQFGYMSYHWINNESSAAVPYSSLAGKIGTITEIQPRQAGTLNFRRVVIKLDSSGNSVITNALNDSISDVTLLSDIEWGRKLWVGKTLWYKSKYIRPSTEAEIVEWQIVKKFRPATVAAVMVGEGANGSIDFVLQYMGGQEGLAHVNLSASNTSPENLESWKRLGFKECSFDNLFFTEDPRITHKWPADVWDALENDKVLVGMTLEQVIFGWGEPKTINTTKTANSVSSQLVYSENRFVYIDDLGKVTAIQQ